MTQLSETTPRARITSLPRLHVPPHVSVLITFVITTLLIFLSIVLFMLDSTADQVNKLLAAQNDASLKLRSSLEYYQHHKPTDESLPPGLVDDLVVYARINGDLVKVSHRLTPFHIFTPSAHWEVVKDEITPLDEGLGEGLPLKFNHLVVKPEINHEDIVAEGWYQIKLYQAIREYSQDKVAIDKSYVTAISIYILPCLYALLGAFLHACRAHPPKKGEGHGGRYAMAFIFGATISIFSSLIPKDLLLPPLALAFLAGYSIDAFTSRLDALVESMKHPAKH